MDNITRKAKQRRDRRRMKPRDPAAPSEREFQENEVRRLAEFAGLVHACGRSPDCIALACNLDVRTVRRAMDGQPIKSDAQARIEYYIMQQLRQRGGCRENETRSEIHEGPEEGHQGEIPGGAS